MSSATELQVWLNGTVNGGPNGDGRYPMTAKDGQVFLVYCPAAQALNPSLAEQPIEVFANTASNAATTATAEADEATQASINAQTHAANAAGSATAAGTSASTAATSASNAATSATNAASSASAASGSASTASTASTTAVTARDKAQKWADELVDTLVETGKYSARHWAQKAADSASSAGAFFSKPQINTSAGMNLLPNGGCELVHPTLTWRALCWLPTGSLSGTSASVVTSLLPGSTKAQRVETTTPLATPGQYIDIYSGNVVADGYALPKVEEGKKYVLSVSARGTPGMDYRTYIQILNSAGTVILTTTATATPITGSFQRYVLPLHAVVPAGGVKANVYAGRLFNSTASNAALWLEVDDVQFQEGEVATAYQHDDVSRPVAKPTQTAIDVMGALKLDNTWKDRNFLTDTRGTVRAPNYYDIQSAQWDFQNTADTGAGGDTWHGLLTVHPWNAFLAGNHVQQQIAFTGSAGLKFRYATSETAWAAWQTLWTSGNFDPTLKANSSAPSFTTSVDLKNMGGTGAGIWYDGPTLTRRAFVGMEAGSETLWRIYSAQMAANAVTVDLTNGALTATGTVQAPMLKFNGGGTAGPGTIFTNSNWGMLNWPKVAGTVAAHGWTNVAGTEIMRLTDTGTLSLGGHATSGTLSVNGGAVAFGAKATIHSAAGTQCYLNLWQAGIGTGGFGFLPNSSIMHIVNSYATGELVDGKGMQIDSNGNIGFGGVPIAGTFYRTTSYGGFFAKGASAQLATEDRSTGAVYALYANAGSLRIYNGTSDVFNMTLAGAVTLSSSLGVPNTVTSTGSNAGYFFDNRSGTARQYGWYATANSVRLNVSTIGDALTITEGGILSGPGISQSTVGSTLVQRNPSGYIFNNYYNMTANDIGAAAAGRIAIETGSDGYLRWQSVANFFGAANTGGVNPRFRDVYCDRGDGSGVVFLNGAGTRYVYFDGSSYVMPGAPLVVYGNITGTTVNATTLSAGTITIPGSDTTITNNTGMMITGNFRFNGEVYDLTANGAAWVRKPRQFVGTTVDINQMSENDVFFEI